MIFYIVFTDSEVILTHVEYESWRELQNDFCDFQSSVGPFSEAEVLEYLQHEQSNLSPSALEQIRRFKSSGHNEVALTFKGETEFKTRP